MSQAFRNQQKQTGSVRHIIKMANENMVVMAVYRYKLHDGTGGTFRTGSPTVDLATRELKNKYGNRFDPTSVERVVA